jgi:fucose permease
VPLHQQHVFIAFGVMSFVMAASPLAIVQCGLSATEAPVTIFVHVMGMFVPSFFTGNLIARFGIFNVMIAGIVLPIIFAATPTAAAKW